MPLAQLLEVIAADPRIEGFQGLHVNRDGTLLINHRWGGNYYTSVDAYLADLNKFLDKAAKAQAVEGAAA